MCQARIKKSAQKGDLARAMGFEELPEGIQTSRGF